MSVGFRAVQWNRKKLVYDGILLAAVALYITGFAAIYWRLHPPKNLPDAIDIWIRAFGTCAFLMLTVILSIGPLARLSPRFLPLLYNRRHFGVLTFLVAALHVWFMLDWYMVQDNLPNLATELTTWSDYRKFIGFPFKVLGIGALLILFLMAATSHDFWLSIPDAAHLESAAHGALRRLRACGDACRPRHHAIRAHPAHPADAGGRLRDGGSTPRHRRLARADDRQGVAPNDEGWVAVGLPRSIPDKGARIIAAPGGERIAVFRDGNQIGAVTNLCAHQNGPLGEGRIIDGCIVCPWHGYEYKLADGCAPPPFTEKLATYRARINRGIIEIDPRPLPPGTPAAITCPLEAM